MRYSDIRMKLPAFIATLVAASALAAPVSQPHSSAELLVEQSTIVPGKAVTLGLHLKLEKDWHVYWKNPGDSGMATSIAWRLPNGFSAGPLQWPVPRRIDVGPITSYGYDDEVTLLTDITISANHSPATSVIQAKADWLVCKEICIPATADFSVNLGASRSPGDARPKLFRLAREQLPRAFTGWKARVGARDNALIFTLEADAGLSREGLGNIAFFPEKEGDIEDSATQVLTTMANSHQLVVRRPQASPALDRISGVLVAQSGTTHARGMQIDQPIGVAPPAAQVNLTLMLALAFAFVGGIILNLMPCVFPVLAIKILGVMERAHGERAHLRRHAMLFTVGVVASFVGIAGVMLWLRAHGEAMGWGFQLQSPWMVSVLALLFFAMGLNLSGVYQLGAGLQSMTGAVRLRNDHLDALTTGLLATLVATPCTAPFMAAALGYAISQPPIEALAVFGMVGAGMALPYALLCFMPSALRRLPRPGPWMETTKQFLAFPLYATVVWLVWVTAQQSGADGAARLLFAMVTLACALWWWGRRRGLSVAHALIVTALLVVTAALAWPPPEPTRERAQVDGWSPWSETAVETAVSKGQPVFVDFTAAWCVSCQFNKRLVLNTPTVSRRMQDRNVLRLRADWTNRDAPIGAAMTRLGRSGVPIYALYIPGQSQPRLLPEILTTGILLDALAALPLTMTDASAISPKE